METLEAVVIQMDPHRIDVELEKANVTQAIIRRLRENAEPLLGKPIETKAERELVHAAEMACVRVRNTAVAICKKERDPAIAYQKAVIAKEKEVTAEIEAIEAPLKKLKADFDAIAQKRMEEDAHRYAEQLRARKARLFQIGYRFDGTSYVLDGFSTLTEEEVTGSAVNELKLGEYLSEIERQVAEHRELEEEKARTAKIAADAIAAQQKEEAARVAAIAAEQDRKAKELAEKEAAMNARILNARAAQLNAIGAVEWLDDQAILAMDDAAFEVFAVEAKAKVEARAQAQKQAEEKAAAERKANEERIAAEALARAEQERIAAEARAKEEEAERVAKMSDAAKFREYHAALLAIPVPTMNSKAGQKRIAEVVAQIKALAKA